MFAGVTPAKEPVPNDDRIVELYQQIGEKLSIPIVLQDHSSSTEVHMPAGLIARILRSVPSIGAVKEEAVPTAPKIRQLRDAFTDRPLVHHLYSRFAALIVFEQQPGVGIRKELLRRVRLPPARDYEERERP
jgi:4-hydroxy-tetrahydrodipicolinate synthase